MGGPAQDGPPAGVLSLQITSNVGGGEVVVGQVSAIPATSRRPRLRLIRGGRA